MMRIARAGFFSFTALVASLVALPKSNNRQPMAIDPSLQARLQGHVQKLAIGVCLRSTTAPVSLALSARYVEDQLRAAGYRPERRYFQVDGRWLWNIVAVRPGYGKRWVIGAHYDSVATSPGADDNASGVAVLLEL